MVEDTLNLAKEAVWDLLEQIPDPDIPVVSIVELGLVRNVEFNDKGVVEVTLTPSYSGCPAMLLFKNEIDTLLKGAGYEEVDVKISLTPAWTTDFIGANAREKMRKHGIAPPEEEPNKDMPFVQQKEVTCPRCQKTHTHVVSRFGSTPCKALWYCDDCAQPFEYFKCF